MFLHVNPPYCAKPSDAGQCTGGLSQNLCNKSRIHSFGTRATFISVLKLCIYCYVVAYACITLIPVVFAIDSSKMMSFTLSKMKCFSVVFKCYYKVKQSVNIINAIDVAFVKLNRYRVELQYLHSFARSSCSFHANRLKAADRAENVFTCDHPSSMCFRRHTD